MPGLYCLRGEGRSGLKLAWLWNRFPVVVAARPLGTWDVFRFGESRCAFETEGSGWDGVAVDGGIVGDS